MLLLLLFYVKDFEAIGIDKRGFRLRLQKAAKRLPSLPIYTDVPVSQYQVSPCHCNSLTLCIYKIEL